MQIKIITTLDHDKDSDIISYLDGMSGIMRNRLIKDLLRSHISGELSKETIKDQLQDILDAVQNIRIMDISRPVESHYAPKANDDTDTQEALANLEGLGL